MDSWLADPKAIAAEFSSGVSTYLPRLVVALVLIALGWAIGSVLRWLTVRLIARLARIRTGRAVEQAVRSSGVEKAASEIISRVVFWTVLAFFAALACEALGLSVASAGLSLLARYLPTVLGAIVIILAGLVLGNLARDAVATVSASMGIAGTVPGQAVRWTVIVLAAIVALDQIGIDSTLLILAVGIVLASVVGSAALAVGLGTRTEVGNLVAVHYVARSYAVGQTIRIGETEGRIVEFRTNGVVIDTPDGRVLVPGREFSERASRLIVEASE